MVLRKSSMVPTDHPSDSAPPCNSRWYSIMPCTASPSDRENGCLAYESVGVVRLVGVMAAAMGVVEVTVVEVMIWTPVDSHGSVDPGLSGHVVYP